MGGNNNSNNRFTPPFTENQIRAFNIAPKITSSLSIFGSIFVIQHILRSPGKKRLKTVYHRILLGMSIMDLIFSIKQFVGKWAVPANEPVYSAAGTEATCTVFGFLGQGSALASIYYSGFLTLFFFLVVRLGWSEDKIRKFVEPYIHTIALCMGWGTAIIGLIPSLQLYNSGSTGCWINSSPPGCQESFNAENNGVEPTCIKGDNSAIYRIVFFWGQLWIIWILCVIAMILIYLGIYKSEKQISYSPSLEFRVNNINQRTLTSSTQTQTQTQPQPSSSENETTTGNNNNNNNGSGNATRNSSRRQQQNTTTTTTTSSRKHSKRFAIQAMLYCTFFFLTWGFATIHKTMESFGNNNNVYSPLILLTVSFIPLQGFCNFLIYIRPRYLRYRRRRRQQQRNKRNNNNPQQEQRQSSSTHYLIRWWSNINIYSRFNIISSSSSSKDPSSSTSIHDNNNDQKQKQNAVLSSSGDNNYNATTTTTTTTTGVYDNEEPQPQPQPPPKEESATVVSNLNSHSHDIITEDEDDDDDEEEDDSVGSSIDLEYLE